MQVLISVSHLNPCDVSATSSSRKLHLSSIQESSQSYPKCYMCFSPPSGPVSTASRSQDSYLNAIHVLYDLWQYPCINIPPPCCISPPSRCRYSHLIPIQVAYHLQPALIMCGQPPFWFHLIPIQVEIWISPPSTYRLTSTKAPIVTSHCHPGRVSPPPMSRHLHLTSIQGMNQLFPIHENCISALRSPYKDLQVSQCTSSFHPIPASPAPRTPNSCNLPDLCTVSPVSRSLYSNLTSVQVPSHLQPGLEFGVSPHSRSHVTSIQVTRIAHQLHPSPIPTFPCIKICSLTQFRSHGTPIHFLRLTSHLNLGS